MKLKTIIPWLAQVIASFLVLLSLFVAFEIYQMTLGDDNIRGYGHTTDGAPANAASGVAIAVGLAIGAVAAVAAFTISMMSRLSNTEQTIAQRRTAKLVRYAAVAGLVSPWVFMLLEK